MTNKECVEHLKKFKFGLAFLNHLILDEADKDKIDIEALDFAIKALEDRPTGEWLTDERGYVCSECGALHIDDYPFCHMCGVQMSRGKQ